MNIQESRTQLSINLNCIYFINTRQYIGATGCYIVYGEKIETQTEKKSTS